MIAERHGSSRRRAKHLYKRRQMRQWSNTYRRERSFGRELGDLGESLQLVVAQLGTLLPLHEQCSGSLCTCSQRYHRTLSRHSESYSEAGLLQGTVLEVKVPASKLPLVNGILPTLFRYDSEKPEVRLGTFVSGHFSLDSDSASQVCEELVEQLQIYHPVEAPLATLPSWGSR